MSVTIGCDHCGERIEHGAGYHVLRAERDRRNFRREWTGHYHDGACWDAIEAAICGAPALPAVAEPDRWRDLPVGERERIVVEILGDHRRLTNRGIFDAVRERFPGVAVYTSDITAITTRLRRCGEIVCETEPWKGRTRNRFHRNTTLQGEIADLQRALDEPGQL